MRTKVRYVLVALCVLGFPLESTAIPRGGVPVEDLFLNLCAGGASLPTAASNYNGIEIECPTDTCGGVRVYHVYMTGAATNWVLKTSTSTLGNTTQTPRTPQFTAGDTDVYSQKSVFREINGTTDPVASEGWFLLNNSDPAVNINTPGHVSYMSRAGWYIPPGSFFSVVNVTANDAAAGYACWVEIPR